MNLKDRVKIENNNLEKCIARDTKLVSELPPGNLTVATKKNHVEWYVTFDKTKKRTYLSISENDKARDLALKGYLKARLRENNEKLRATKAYMRICKDISYSEEYLNKNSEIGKLLAGTITSKEKYVNEWLKKFYSGARPYPEQLTVNTKAGIKVRSKSEQIIVGHLFDQGIPFKYEDRLMFKTHDIFPDFTILNPRTHEIYIWEHLGKMDDDAYRSNNIKKLNDYARLGYFLGENLIMTFETEKSGIDEMQIDFIIEHYFT